MNEKTINFSFFSSRLARRILVTFVASALVPVAVLAVLSLYQVSHQLETQTHQRLRRAAKNHGLSIYEHLLFCEDELKLVGVRSGRDRVMQQKKFNAIGRRYPDGRYEAILGDPIPPLALTDDQRDHLANGETVVVVTDDETPHITLVRHADGGADAPGLVMGRVRDAYLWGIESGTNLPRMTECTVTTDAGRLLFRSPGWPTVPTALHRPVTHGQHRLDLAGDPWFLADWLLFLRPKFAIGNWTIMVIQPEVTVMAPIARFKLIFLLVVCLALMLVVGLSLFNLRRSLEPINALKAGARCVARREFDYRVTVKSKDEFLELAQSFNDMSSQLGKQFALLATQAKIDQATLMAQDFVDIAGLCISRILREFPFRMVAIGRVNTDNPEDALSFVGHGKFPDTIHSQPFTMEDADLAQFDRDLPWKTITDRTLLGKYLPENVLRHLTWVTLFPVFVTDRLYALLGVAGHEAMVQSEETLPLMRQIADHLAVAWSNVNLIRDLKRLTIGSMQALARTVDAKSSWTAGHSARVQQVAMSIGRQMNLNETCVERLRYGALLHDIGKIGVRTGILDKAGRLTDEEFDAIREHPAIGDRILSPIAAFQDIRPVVRHHHERWDGKGYPDGLAGEAICLEARILAVADVYDAIASDRPYRRGMPPDKVMSIIQSEAGRQFDPEVVAAFMETMAEKAELAA